MTALTALVQDTAPPRVQVTATNVTAGDGMMTLYRDADGLRTPVRGAIDVPTEATYVAVDSEAPFGIELTYTLVVTYADGSTETTSTAATVTLEAVLPWISHPVTGEGVAVTIADWPEFTYSARQSVVAVSGRAAPIVVSDARLAPTSAMVVLIRTRADLMALRDLLASGDVLQVRAVCDAVEGQYVAIGDVVETRVKAQGKSTDERLAGSDWRRLVTLNVQAVDRPIPKTPAAADTLADLNAYVPTTLADIAATWPDPATLLTIAQTSLKGA